MRSKQIPSTDTFLVRTDAGRRQSASTRLAALGTVERADDAGGVVIHLRGDPAGDPKAAWRKLQEEVDDLEVDPVLLDQTGRPHFPTGEVTVRFKEPPTDAYLASFAEKHGLKVRSRNEYMPVQVAFQVAGRRYLPEVLESLAPSDDVASAWANTRSSYRRS